VLDHRQCAFAVVLEAWQHILLAFRQRHPGLDAKQAVL